VHLTADDGPAMRTVEVLISWMAGQPVVRLHTVLWLPGWSSTARFEAGTFHDVARDHRRRLPRALRRAGSDRLAGKVTVRAIRSTLRTVPRSGGLYLNGVVCAPALRYLPPGDRRVVTHLHASDREAVPDVPPEHLARLVEATDVWFADDEETRDWAASALGIDPDEVELVGELVDLAEWEATHVPADPDRLDLAVAGGTWFRSDHTARLVQTMLRLRPELDLRLLWTEVEREEHLAPLLHDLDLLGVRDRLHIPGSHAELHDRLREVRALVLTTPDEVPPWLAWQAAKGGLPVACFDSHPHAAEVGRSPDGRVVEYLDLVGLAEAVIGFHDDVRTGAHRRFEDGRAALAAQDVSVIGDRLVDLARGGGR
jgi:hypothetical protein